jgi:hypothetical protein
LIGRIRWIAVGGLAGVVSGVLVLGLGGRLVMLASRLLHPDTAGRLTENGNRIACSRLRALWPWSPSAGWQEA